MMGERPVMQEALFYGCSLERHLSQNQSLAAPDRPLRRSKRAAGALGTVL